MKKFFTSNQREQMTCFSNYSRPIRDIFGSIVNSRFFEGNYIVLMNQ